MPGMLFLLRGRIGAPCAETGGVFASTPYRTMETKCCSKRVLFTETQLILCGHTWSRSVWLLYKAPDHDVGSMERGGLPLVRTRSRPSGYAWLRFRVSPSEDRYSSVSRELTVRSMFWAARGTRTVPPNLSGLCPQIPVQSA